MTDTGATVAGPRYPECVVKLSGTDGNAFAIMGAVRLSLKVHLRGTCTPELIKATLQMFLDEAKSGDYDNLLRVCMKWVTVE